MGFRDFYGEIQASITSNQNNTQIYFKAISPNNAKIITKWIKGRYAGLSALWSSCAVEEKWLERLIWRLKD